LSIHLF